MHALIKPGGADTGDAYRTGGGKDPDNYGWKRYRLTVAPRDAEDEAAVLPDQDPEDAEINHVSDGVLAALELTVRACNHPPRQNAQDPPSSD